MITYETDTLIEDNDKIIDFIKKRAPQYFKDRSLKVKFFLAFFTGKRLEYVLYFFTFSLYEQSLF